MKLNVLCGLSNLPIFYEDRIVMIMLIKDNKKYVPLSLPIYGIYNNGIEKIENIEYIKEYFEFLKLNIDINKINEKSIRGIKVDNKPIKLFYAKRKYFDLLIDSEKSLNIFNDNFCYYKLNKFINDKYMNEYEKLKIFDCLLSISNKKYA